MGCDMSADDRLFGERDWSGLFEDTNGFPMPYVEQIFRYRPKSIDNPYNPDDKAVDYSSTDQTDIYGFITANSSEDRDGLDTTVTNTATLTCPDPDADIQIGDVICTDNGNRYVVTGFKRSETNPFTGWRPTLVATLEEVRG